MKLTYFKSNNELAQKVAEEIQQLPKNSNILVPSGSTPEAIYDLVSQQDWVDNYQYFALDEWLNIPISADGSCFSMIDTDFIQKCHKKIDFTYFEPNFTLQQNSQKYSKKLNNSEFDYVILGVGMNGHIGLNEPGIPYDEDYLEAPLDEITKKVAKQKYFSGDINLDKGVTVGISKILKSKKVIIIINHPNKKEIWKKILNTEDNKSQVPAIYMKQFTNVSFYVTQDLS